ncbi:hypothetical protein Sinac_3538 [Singulisphaera acidiphila DSM 18658]|uniref:Uncharacterized protein n=1 Tax=Singulisphaera acidiphila (strain ATCC BAA-1392 / DSM 18658 / VKM B-2454 / MOB10) TaxID=886293 RepID=L0DEJ4_SINAD|nr:hypothetical protein Sinac_3538 [Singulisphaera acidiphila DSM 18658]
MKLRFSLNSDLRLPSFGPFVKRLVAGNARDLAFQDERRRLEASGEREIPAC